VKYNASDTKIKKKNKRIPRNVELKKMRREIAGDVDSIKDLRTVMTCCIKVVCIIYYRPSRFFKKFSERSKEWNVEISPMLCPFKHLVLCLMLKHTLQSHC
jgi:hypothetical protein